MIRHVRREDAACIAEIYNHYILDTVVTFEEEIITANDIRERIEKVEASCLPWVVAEENGQVIGYAYAAKWNDRSAYDHSVELSVYLSHNASSQGWGTKLYESLFAQLKSTSIRAVMGVIALPNPASIALHEKFGMEKVGHFREVGFKFDHWIDVGYWQIRINASPRG